MPSIAYGNVTTSAGNVYTSSGNTVITWLSLCNYSAANVTANVFVVASGNSAGNATTILSNIAITTGDTYQIYNANEKLILSNGDAIAANASANNSITVVTSYTSA